ncbi:hypothetical protein BKA69DRAFT_1082539 [Paraphysoderma sedebokerense]|nr:hypothetical protein BKA69DRAFT_1082539 [Paraphysoderma sedebokerense]
MDATGFVTILFMGVNIGMAILSFYRCSKLKLTPFAKFNLLPLACLAFVYCILAALTNYGLISGDFSLTKTVVLLVYIILPMRNILAGYNYYVRLNSIFFQNPKVAHAGWGFIIITKLYLIGVYLYCLGSIAACNTLLEYFVFLSNETLARLYATASLFLGAEGFILDVVMLIQVIRVKRQLNTHYSIHFTRYLNILLVILCTLLNFVFKSVNNGAYNILSYQFDTLVITISTLVMIDFYEIDIALISNKSANTSSGNQMSTGTSDKKIYV